jgi:hypothetical protein
MVVPYPMVLEAALLWSLGAVELRWESVAGCPDAVAIGRDLDALLGEGPRAPAVEVTGRLLADRDAYVLHLEVALRGQREARELRANDCVVLARAGVLVVGVTVDALSTVAVTEELGADVPARASAVAEPPVGARPGLVAERRRPAAGPPSPRETPATSAKTRPPQGLTLAASAGLSQGMTPGIAGGLEGQLGWRRGALRVLVGGFHWFSRSSELRPEIGIESALSGGSLRGCIAFERVRLEVPICAGVDLAAMHGGGVGAAVQRRDVRDWWVGVAAGAGLAFWPTRRFALQARAEGVIGARRPAMFLSIDGEAQEAFRMPPVGVRFFVGPIVRVW